MYKVFGKNYKAATYSDSYLLDTGIIMQSLKSLGQFKHAYIRAMR